MGYIMVTQYMRTTRAKQIKAINISISSIITHFYGLGILCSSGHFEKHHLTLLFQIIDVFFDFINSQNKW